MHKISVIIPIYNTEKYLEDCLNSVLNNTYKNIEIVCIDDGSTDNSLSILKKYQSMDERIEIISQKNSGVIISRNTAIKKAKGEFIFPLDSDDIIDSKCLEKLLNAIIENKGDIICSRVKCFGEENYELKLPPINKYNMSRQNCLVNAALFRKSLFEKSGGYDCAFDKGLEDYDLWLNMIYRQSAKFYRIPEILFYYRIKTTQESRNKQAEKHNKNLLKQLKQKYPAIKWYQLLHKIRKYIFYIKEKGNRVYVRILGITLFKYKQ